ncbi:hypothetical protein [Bradyrhizobium liaoningense]
MAVRGRAMMIAQFGILLIWQDAALAQQGTPEQRAACQGDALRLCSSFIPDADRIATCLRQNEAKLSKECHAVVFVRGARGRSGAQNGSHAD